MTDPDFKAMRKRCDAATEGFIQLCRQCGIVGPHRRKAKCRACEAEYARQWKKLNPDEARRHAKTRRQRIKIRRPGHEASRKRRKRARRIEFYRAKYRERLAWLRGGDVTKQQLLELVAKSGGLCAYCRTSVQCRLTPSDPRGFDHIIARANGGMHTISNMVVCCGDCNARKSASFLPQSDPSPADAGNDAKGNA